jgi:hypothetical protein
MRDAERRMAVLKLFSQPDDLAIAAEEIAEFKRLDATEPFDRLGKLAWTFEGEPLTEREKRWLELYRKLQRVGLQV